MTHEPECLWQDETNPPRPSVCRDCVIARLAYRRGYLEGREEAAWDVTKVSCLRDTDLCDITEAIAAARGDGQNYTENGIVLTGGAVARGNQECYCESCNDPDCGCLGCGIARGDGEQA